MTSPEQEPDPFENAYLYAFPNPERVGCPGSDVLRGLATKDLPISHPARLHLMQCSPCFQEFRQLQREIGTRRRQRTRVLLASAAILVLAVLLGWFWRMHERRSHVEIASNHAPGVLNFSAALNRGQGSVMRDQTLPRTVRDVAIMVPFHDQPGHYDVKLRRASDDRLVLQFSGTVSADQTGIKTLRAPVNFSQLSPGSYQMAWRQQGSTIEEVGEFVLQ